MGRLKIMRLLGIFVKQFRDVPLVQYISTGLEFCTEYFVSFIWLGPSVGFLYCLDVVFLSL